MDSEEFRKQVKDALEHLYDTAYLQVHPLLSQIADTVAGSQLTRAQRLRSILKDTLEALRPQSGTPSSAPEWRSYLALRYHYIQGMSMAQIEDELGISLRQLQRELRKGLDALSQLLWDMRVTKAAGAPLSAESVGELRELQDELSQWELARQPCDIKELIEDTLWVLKPVLEQQGGEVRVDLPADLPLVLVDATLTRQTLFKVLRLLVQHSSSIWLRAARCDKQVNLTLHGQRTFIEPEAQDWQMAELFVSQQGGSLTIGDMAEGGQQVVLSLPCADQIRVLVIDDNQAIHRLFERYLTAQHYEVIHAYGGQEALYLAAEANPDLITLDVMMPNVDGWQVLRSLVQNPATKHIPVIICSVLREPELAFSIGARAYLKKPVERMELLTTLARLYSQANPAPAVLPPAQPNN